MNKVILMGRLTRDPEVRYSQGDNPMAIARYTLAVDRATTETRQQTLSDAWHSEKAGNLQRSIFARA
jgi:single-strand DNA-binding protein